MGYCMLFLYSRIRMRGHKDLGRQVRETITTRGGLQVRVGDIERGEKREKHLFQISACRRTEKKKNVYGRITLIGRALLTGEQVVSQGKEPREPATARFRNRKGRLRRAS